MSNHDANYCIQVSHFWDDISGLPAGQRTGITYLSGIRVAFRCANCGSMKHEVRAYGTYNLVQREYDQSEEFKRALIVVDKLQGLTRKEASWKIYDKQRKSARRAG